MTIVLYVVVRSRICLSGGYVVFFSSRRRHTRCALVTWSSDVCSSDLRIMAEDVRAPRGAACITYSQECARELTRRLERLGLREASNQIGRASCRERVCQYV